MKIPMMQSIIAINKIPGTDTPIMVHCAKISNKAVEIRKRCLELVRAGVRCLDSLAASLKVHRTTIIHYLRELSEKGFIEFTTKGRGGAKIVNVL